MKLQLFCPQTEITQDTFVDHDAIKLEMENQKQSYSQDFFKNPHSYF